MEGNYAHLLCFMLTLVFHYTTHAVQVGESDWFWCPYIIYIYGPINFLNRTLVIDK